MKCAVTGDRDSSSGALIIFYNSMPCCFLSISSGDCCLALIYDFGPTVQR